MLTKSTGSILDNSLQKPFRTVIYTLSIEDTFYIVPGTNSGAIENGDTLCTAVSFLDRFPPCIKKEECDNEHGPIHDLMGKRAAEVLTHLKETEKYQHADKHDSLATLLPGRNDEQTVVQ
jgi:hypothetical protein